MKWIEFFCGSGEAFVKSEKNENPDQYVPATLQLSLYYSGSWWCVSKWRLCESCSSSEKNSHRGLKIKHIISTHIYVRN